MTGCLDTSTLMCATKDAKWKKFSGPNAGEYPGVEHLLKRKQNLACGLCACHDLGPCTPFHCEHSHFCLFCFACPSNTLPRFGEFTTPPDLASLCKPPSFSSSVFIKSRNDMRCERLKNWKCLTHRREDFGGGGWWRKPLIETSPNIWRAGTWKKAVA